MANQIYITSKLKINTRSSPFPISMYFYSKRIGIFNWPSMSRRNILRIEEKTSLLRLVLLLYIYIRESRRRRLQHRSSRSIRIRVQWWLMRHPRPQCFNPRVRATPRTVEKINPGTANAKCCQISYTHMYYLEKKTIINSWSAYF